MKISLDWVKDYVDLPEHLTPAGLSHELTLKTVEVENHVDLQASLRHVVTGHVLDLRPHESGATVATCAVGSDRRATVVTRATNLQRGALVAIALPGAAVNGREIQPTTVGGVVSDAYLCRAADLGLERLFPAGGPGDALVLDELEAEPGSPLAEAVSWQDTVLEIDNKSLTNRPDLWGHYGIAREFAAIYRVPLLPLCPMPQASRPKPRTDLIGSVDPNLCRRLALVEFAMEHDTPSPLWLRNRLARLGEASVNLTVDLGNFVMFATGQPVHVYDADQLTLPLSAVLESEPVELDLLDGRRAQIEEPAPLIRDARGPIALAGIMGGADSAVGPGSRRYILEVASFQPQTVRRAAQQLGLRTEAATRFEKGLDTQRVDQAIDLYLTLLATIAPDVTTTGYQDYDPSPTQGAHIEVGLDFLNARIGLDLDQEEIRGTLEALGFDVTLNATTVAVTAPTWRSTGDVSIPDDILEEVARIHGYEAIPAATLGGTFAHLSPTEIRPLDRRVREQLAARADMHEVVTYAWSADHALRAAGFDPADGVGFEGAPAPDRSSLRPSLVPNLLEAVAQNLRYSDAFDLFEVGTVFPGGEYVPYADQFEAMPPQAKHAAAMLVGSDGPALFQRAKGVLEMLRRHCHLTELKFVQAERVATGWADQAARLDLIANHVRVGTLGLLSTRCRRLSGIDQTQVACFELDLTALRVHATRENVYRPVSEFPESDFDLSAVIPAEATWAQVEESVLSVGGLVGRVGFVGEFRGSWVPEGRKSTTIRITLRPQSSTLAGEDIANARNAVLAALSRDFGAYLR